MTADPAVIGLLYYKALLNKYGMDRTVDLKLLADRAVQDGLYPNVPAAIAAIEKHMGLPVTAPETS